MADITSYLKKAREMDKAKGVEYTHQPTRDDTPSKDTTSSRVDLSSYLAKAREMDARNAAKKKEDEEKKSTEEKSTKSGNETWWERLKDSDFVKAVSSGVKNYAASHASNMRVKYEKGQAGRTARDKEQREWYAHQLERATYDLSIMEEDNALHPGTWSEKQLAAQRSEIEQLKVKVGAFDTVINEQVQQKATKATAELVGDIQRSAEADLEQAKEGRGFVGQAAVDLTAMGTQLVGDALVGKFLGNSKIDSAKRFLGKEAAEAIPGISRAAATRLAMGTRVFGSSAQEAYEEGKNLNQQIGYGASSAALEVGTEMLFDGLAGLFGKGAADDLVSSVIARMTTNPTGQKALRVVASMGGEAVEEVIAGAVNPLLKDIAYGEKLGSNYDENTTSDILYGALLGGIMGLAGGGVEVTMDSFSERSGWANSKYEEAVKSMYNEEQDPTQYISEMNAAYAAGMRGAPIDSVAVTAITPEQTQAAYNEGVAFKATKAKATSVAETETEEAEAGGDHALLLEATKTAQEASKTETPVSTAETSSVVQPKPVAREKGVPAVERPAGSNVVAASDIVYQAATQKYGADIAHVVAAAYKLGNSEVKVSDYLAGFKAAYDAGVNGLTVEEAVAAAPALEGWQVQEAWQLGAESKNTVTEVRNVKRQGTGTFTDKTTGKATDNWQSFTTVLEGVAHKLGVDIETVDIIRAGKGTANGAMIRDMMTMVLSRNSENAMQSLGHEMSEFIEAFNPKAMDSLRTDILRYWAKTQSSTSVRAMIKSYQGTYEAAVGSKTYEQAEAEAVNDALGAILASEEGVDALMEWLHTESGMNAQEQKNFIQKLAELFQNIVNALKNLLKNGGLTAMQQDMVHMEIEQKQDILRRLFAAADMAAVYAKDTGQYYAELVQAGIGIDEDTDTAFSVRFSPAYTDSIKVGKKSFDVDSIVKAVATGTGRSEADARKWVESEMTIANIVMQDPEFLDFEPDARYNAIKTNSDYPQGSVDLSNLCPKREELTAIYDRLQKKYPDRLFTAADLAEMRQILADHNIVVACGACFVEDRRQLVGEIADTYIGMWKEAIASGKTVHKVNAKGNKVPMHITAKIAKKYGVTKGAPLLATDTYIPTQYDLTTYEGFRALQENHPTVAMGFELYNNSRGQQAARLIEGRAEYNRQILGWSDAKVKRVNNNGGLRIFSFSDFEVVHLLDLVQVIMDCSARGVKIQGYTKIPAFARLIRNTGIKLNRSLIPKGDTGIKVVNGKRVLDIDTVEGIDINDENFLDESDNPNVGNIIIGINPEQIGISMLDDFIDYIIPFHSNKSKEILKKLGTGAWVNYKESQHDKDIATGKASAHNVNIYTEVLAKYHPQNKVEFVNAFLKECKAQGKIPRYAEFLNVDENGDYAYREGYHKLLLDFKMFDKDGNILPQGNIQPELDTEFMAELLAKEVDRKKNYEFPQAVYDEIEARLIGRAEYTVPDGADAAMSITPETDKAYLAAVESGDMATAQQMVEDAARAAGYDSPKLYHGSPNFGFTKIDTMKSDDELSFFTTDSLEVAETYSGKGKVKQISDDVYDDIDSIEEAFRDKQVDLCEYINHAAGYRSYIEYTWFDKFWDAAVHGSKSMDYIRDEFYEDIEGFIQELFPYSKYYERINDEGVDEDEMYDKFAESEEIQRIYSAANDLEFILRAARADNSGNYQFYADTSNLFELDAEGNAWSRIPFSKYDKNGFHPVVNTRQAARYAKANGFDGVKITNVFDDGGRSVKKQRTSATVYIFFKPQEQVKSADPVTYDDNGNIIPLSERFNPKNEDIRYSVTPDRESMTKMTDREILSEAAGQIDTTTLTSGEADALRIFKNRLDKLGELQNKRKELGELYREQMFVKGKVDRNEAVKTRNRMQVLDSQITKAENEVLKAENAEVLKRVLKRARKVVASEQKAHDDVLLKRYRERRQNAESVKKYRDRIEKKVKKLGDMLLKNSDKQHIPEVLKGLVGEFISTIDFTSKQQLRGGEATKKDRKFINTLDKIHTVLDKQARLGDEGTTDFDAYLDLPDGFTTELKGYIDKVRGAIEGKDIETPYVNMMSAAELEDLDFIVGVIYNSINKANELLANARYKNVSDAAETTIFELSPMKEHSGKRGVGKFLNWDNTTPVYAFKRFGEGGRAIFEGLQDGWDKFALNAKAVIDFAKTVYTAKEVKEWSNKVHTFEIDGREVQMTTTQVMSLYCLMKREQAQGHIFGGGMRIGNFTIENGKLKKKSSVQQTDAVHPTLEHISPILSVLTDRQIEVADALQNFMNTVGTEWGNAVSMARFGYKAFGEENYFPIVSDSNNLPSQDPGAKTSDLYRLLNMCFTKSLTPKANNALVVDDIFEVFAAHMSDMAKYNALALPVLDAMKFYNYKQTTKEGEKLFTSTVQKTIEKAYGKDGQSYFIQFMKDLNGVHDGGRSSVEKLSMKMVSNYKIASVGANLRVALLQPTSLLRASVVIDQKYLVKALTMKPAVKEMLEHSGIAVWKDLGFYDVDIGRGVRDQIKHEESFRDKAIEKSMIAAEMMDKVTWGALWNACKLECTVKGEKDLMAATAKRFREVVYASQVVDSTMTRSQTMRDNSSWTKILTAFMSEPTLSFNTLLDAYNEYVTNKRKGIKNTWANSGKKITRGLLAYGASAVGAALAESIFDALRDDDDYETFLEKFWEAFWLDAYGYDGKKEYGNLLADLNPVNKLPVVKDVVSHFTGYENNRMDTQWLTSFTDAIAAWKSESRPLYGKIYKTLQAASRITGLPLSNISREVATVYNNTVGVLTGKKLKTWQPTDMTGIKEAFKAGHLTKEEAADLLVEKCDYTKSKAKSKVAAWDYQEKYPDLALSDSRVEDYETKAKPAGIDVDVFQDFVDRAKAAKGTDLDGDGKTDSGSKRAAVEKVIDSLPLTTKQKDVLFLLDYSEKNLENTPWH